MAKLFIYYSYTGNGDVVANYLKEKGYEIRKVESNYKLPKGLFGMMMKGGFHASINKKAKLINYNPDVSSYIDIYIGTPIWNGRLAPITNSVLAQTDLKDKNVTFIFYSGSGEAKKATQKINKLYPNARIINLKTPKDYKDELKKLDI